MEKQAIAKYNGSEFEAEQILKCVHDSPKNAGTDLLAWAEAEGTAIRGEMSAKELKAAKAIAEKPRVLSKDEFVKPTSAEIKRVATELDIELTGKEKDEDILKSVFAINPNARYKAERILKKGNNGNGNSKR